MSVASNVQGHELAHCLVTYGDKKNLITRTMAALESIRETAYDLLKGSYEEVRDEMAALRTAWDDKLLVAATESFWMYKNVYHQVLTPIV